MGLLPDIDILIQWGTYKFLGKALIFHGGFTHQLYNTALDCAVEGGYPLMPPFLSNDICVLLVPPAYQTDFLAGLDAILFVT